MTGLPLSHGRPIGSVAVRGNVFDLDGDDIATAQLAVDCKIKHRKVARSPLHLQPRPDRPDVLHRKVARSPLHLQPRPDRPDVLRSQRRWVRSAYPCSRGMRGGSKFSVASTGSGMVSLLSC
jgi:hypothetical protein